MDVGHDRPTMTTDPLAALDASDEERQRHIVAVLVDAFDDLIDADPRAFRRKFRKMAADPFAFYRGSAPLFYADVERLEDPWVDEAHVARVDPGRPARRELRHLHGLGRRARVRRQRLRRGLPGPLHVGPPADGRLARAAGLRQGALRRHDPAPDRDLRDLLRGDGADVRDDVRRPRVPAHARQHRGGAARRAGGGAAGDARPDARPAHDARPGGPAVRHRPRRARAGRGGAGGRPGGLRGLPRHDPRGQAPAQHLLRGQGRRRAHRVRHRERRAARLQPAGRGPHARRWRTTSSSP